MQISTWYRLLLSLFPSWGLRRIRSRAAVQAIARHYEAASPANRTKHWHRTNADANAVSRVALVELRRHSRDLLRNNSWAQKGQNTVSNNTVGWGIVPRPASKSAEVNKAAAEIWSAWAGSTECDSEGMLSFSGIQNLVARSVFSDGDVLIRRRRRKLEDGLTVPLQLEVLEGDYLDETKNEGTLPNGGRIVTGVEFDALGRRVAYWLFPQHPGDEQRAGSESRRIAATEVLLVFRKDRPGAARGVSWLGSAIVNLKDLDEYEDAELMKQKIAACFAAFVSDPEGTATPLGAGTSDAENDPTADSLEPGMILNLPPGKTVSFGSPPVTTTDSFAYRTLRRIAAGIGVTFEDLTGDYSQVNFSSARMSRIAHQGNVRRWQNDMLIPQLCAVVWRWAMEAAVLAGSLPEVPRAEWTVPPLAMIEPDKEGLAYQRLVRVGAMTPDEMVREQGGDPEAHWAEYAAGLKRLDALGIKLDSDVRAVSQAGLTQERVGAGGGSKPAEDRPPAPPAPRVDDEGEWVEGEWVEVDLEAA